MNELEKTLSEILKKSLALAEKTGDFVIDQAPQLLQEFYNWHIFSNIYQMCFFPIILIAFIIMYKKTEWDCGDFFYELITIILGVSSVVSLTVFLIALYDLIFILVAPKLYLIEYFIK